MPSATMDAIANSKCHHHRFEAAAAAMTQNTHSRHDTKHTFLDSCFSGSTAGLGAGADAARCTSSSVGRINNTQGQEQGQNRPQQARARTRKVYRYGRAIGSFLLSAALSMNKQVSECVCV